MCIRDRRRWVRGRALLWLGVIKEDLIMYDMNFSVEYINDTNIFGNVQDDKNQNGFGK